MDLEQVRKSIRDVPDYPKPGIIFKDVSTAYRDGEVFNFIANSIYEKYQAAGITKVVGIEARGFILGAVIASKLKVGFVPVRKPGKLPAPSFSQSYELEYGLDTLEIHQDALNKNDVVLIHDDLLATGGTVMAAIDLVSRFNVSEIHVNFFIELDFLKGRDKILQTSSLPIWSLIHY
jgi:adenine phosphoribosyltransferase